MTKWDYIGGTGLALMAAFLLWTFLVWVPETKAEQKREIQCETLGGTYHDGQCVEITGTIDLPEEEA